LPGGFGKRQTHALHRWWVVKQFVVVVGAALVALVVGAAWWFKLEPGPPTVEFENVKDVVGRTAAWDVVVRAKGRPGLHSIAVRLRSGDGSFPLYSEELPADGPRETERRVHIDADLAAAGVPQGPAQLEVAADTRAWHLLGGTREARETRNVTVDTIPPRVDLITTQHNMRLGGTALALFRLSPDATDAGIAVGDYYFPALRGYFADPNVALALFAVPQNLNAGARPVVRAVDAAGNVQEVALPVLIKDHKFPERQLQLDDAFLQRKVPEILTAVHKPVPTDLKEGYLTVNRDVRRESEERLRALTAHSADHPLWTGVFHRQSNAAPMSAFADRRSYIYKGDVIDRQTHLGYDLASLKSAPVESAQDGVVVFADYLGIYGNAVVVDHGLGIFSLYGHLSSIAVQPGQQVKAGETLGQTGDTGLAGGDHLHFSVMLDGIHVDPVEWWDPLWLRDHVTAELTSLPRAQPPAPAASEASAGADALADGKAHP
jgi:murein DD-endopeptidase MepM/ murein hydrolase activator NlpD